MALRAPHRFLFIPIRHSPAYKVTERGRADLVELLEAARAFCSDGWGYDEDPKLFRLRMAVSSLAGSGDECTCIGGSWCAVHGDVTPDESPL